MKTEGVGLIVRHLVSKISNVCDHNPPTSQTYGRTERRTTCDGKTALCTRVHRAVIKAGRRDHTEVLLFDVCSPKTLKLLLTNYELV